MVGLKNHKNAQLMVYPGGLFNPETKKISKVENIFKESTLFLTMKLSESTDPNKLDQRNLLISHWNFKVEDKKVGNLKYKNPILMFNGEYFKNNVSVIQLLATKITKANETGKSGKTLVKLISKEGSDFFTSISTEDLGNSIVGVLSKSTENLVILTEKLSSLSS